MAIPELRGIPDGVGGWAARDELYIARVGGEWHLMLRQRVERIIFDGVSNGRRVLYEGNYWSVGYNYAYLNRSPAVLPTSVAVCTHLPNGQLVYPTTANRISVTASAMIVFVLSDALTGVVSKDTGAQRISKFNAFFDARYAAETPVIVDYILATPIVTDLGPIDLPSYYPYTRVLVSGDYPPEVTATCKVVDTTI